MCVACWLPAGKALTKEEFKACWTNNSDGGGLAYANDDGVIVTLKSLDYDEFLAMYFEAAYGDGFNQNIMVHFRIGTSGEDTLLNAHPFHVSDDLVFCHNGIISEYNNFNSELSDTQLFNLDILAKLPRKFYMSRAYMLLLEGFCTGSKLLFMDSVGRHAIVNERFGTWNNGRWFSNTSYSYIRKYTAFNGKGSSNYYSGAEFDGFSGNTGVSGVPAHTSSVVTPDDIPDDDIIEEIVAEIEDEKMMELQAKADHIASKVIEYDNGMQSKETSDGEMIPICAGCGSVFVRETIGCAMALCEGCINDFIMSDNTDEASESFNSLHSTIQAQLLEEACTVWEHVDPVEAPDPDLKEIEA